MPPSKVRTRGEGKIPDLKGPIPILDPLTNSLLSNWLIFIFPLNVRHIFYAHAQRAFFYKKKASTVIVKTKNNNETLKNKRRRFKHPNLIFLPKSLPSLKGRKKNVNKHCQSFIIFFLITPKMSSQVISQRSFIWHTMTESGNGFRPFPLDPPRIFVILEAIL